MPLRYQTLKHKNGQHSVIEQTDFNARKLGWSVVVPDAGDLGTAVKIARLFNKEYAELEAANAAKEKEE